MTERKLTDKEVVKALEKALTDVDAPMGEHWGCGFLTTQNIKDTLDLINRQNAEIERLRNTVKTDFLTVTEKLKLSQSEIGDIRTEAIKEFVERLRDRRRLVEISRGCLIPVVTFRDIEKVEKEMTEGN